MIITHSLANPAYVEAFQEWDKWRTTYAGGKDFIDTYLRKLSKRENQDDFDDRKAVTYCPAFAKEAVNEIRDSIYQRMIDITRAGGSVNYEMAIAGLNGGVDLAGSSMNYFMGVKVLPELLTMQKVGIYVDMPEVPPDASLADTRHARPYLYLYRCEEIINWLVDEDCTNNEFASVLLEESYNTYDKITGFPIGVEQRYRHVWREADGAVFVCFYHTRDCSGPKHDQHGNVIDSPVLLGINKLPFILVEISESLMTDIADYQIALLNLASSDMGYSLRSNFPFYTEQRDATPTGSGYVQTSDKDDPNNPKPKTREIEVGANKGRMYPKGADRPGFIHPSPEPMRVSMEKQEVLKREIRQLVKLAVTNLEGPKMASAASKQEDGRTLESGLSYIGMALQNAEQKTAELFQAYEGSAKCATVFYPETYSLRSEEDRQNEINELDTLRDKVPSKTFQKEITKRIASISLGTKVSRQKLDAIHSEIDAATTIRIDAETIRSDVETGLVSTVFASELRGYPSGEAEKAKEEHAERLARINEAQAVNAANNDPGARGSADASANPNAGKDEKIKSKDTTNKDNTTKPERGNGH